MGRAATCLAAIAVAAIALPAVPSLAAVQCKSAWAAGMGFDETAAINSWRSWVASHHGASWSNFDLAKGKFWSESNLGVVVMRQVQATPCRQALPSFRLPPGGLKTLRQQ